MISCSAGTVDIATGSRAGRSGVRIPAGKNDVSLLHNLQHGCGAHTASYSMDPMAF